MKFTLNRSLFVQQLVNVQYAISSRTTIPILTGIKLDATDEYLALTGSDADISIEAFIQIADEDAQLNIESSGSIVVLPARILSDIVKKLPDELVTIEVIDNTQVSISTETASFVINGIEGSQYPRLPEVQTDDQFTLTNPLFKQVISQTTISVSNQESRPILTGVQFSIEDKKLTAVATDSHRMSRRIIPLETENERDYEFVIPGKSLTELSRLMGDSVENVDMFISDNQVMFKLPNTYVYSRLLEGNYPETNRLIPNETNTKINLGAKDFSNAVDRASLLSHAGKNNVIKLSIGDNHLQVTGNFPDVGRVEEDIDFDKIEGEAIEISFNPDFMKQALNAFGNVDVMVELVGPLRPIVVRPADGNDNFIQLITPIRTPD